MNPHDGMSLKDFGKMIGIDMEKPMVDLIQNPKITHTSITVTTNYGTHSVTVPGVDLCATQMVDSLFIPIMRSMGFTEETIQGLFGVEV